MPGHLAPGVGGRAGIEQDQRADRGGLAALEVGTGALAALSAAAREACRPFELTAIAERYRRELAAVLGAAAGSFALPPQAP